MAEATNVNTTTDDETDFYDDAAENFPSVEDLVGGEPSKKTEKIGRLVAIWAVSNGTAKNREGKSYPYTETITLVLDDGPNGDLATELVGPAPVELKLRHSTTGLTSRLSPRVDGMSKPKRNEEGEIVAPSVPLAFRPYVGRINTRPSTQYKGGSPAFSISLPTDEDRPIIQRYKAEIIEINKRLEAKATAAEDSEAFE